MHNQPSDEELIRLYLSLEEQTEDTELINKLFEAKDTLQELIDWEIQKLPERITKSYQDEEVSLSEQDISQLWEQFESQKAVLRSFYMERILPVFPGLAENVTPTILVEEVIQYLVEYPSEWVFSFVDATVSESDFDELMQELQDRYHRYEDLRDGIIELEMQQVEGDLS